MNNRNSTFIILAVTVIVLAGACNEKDPETEPWEPRPLLPYEKISTTFSLPDVNMEYRNSHSFCDDVNVDYDLSYGGNSGYFYLNGFSYTHYNDPISELQVRFCIRGFDPITTSFIPTEHILALCETYPDQCFVDFIIEYLGKTYSCVSYSIIPYKMERKDPNALYGYQFLEDKYIMECFENWPVIPVKFSYDGYIYTHDRTDSLKVSGFKSSFVVMQAY
ncbi:MAG: hypothetical protein ACKV1O_27185 [Saprospiraceae bacterium]